MVITAPSTLRMHEAIKIRHLTGTPVVIVENNKMVGVIGRRDLGNTPPGERKVTPEND